MASLPREAKSGEPDCDSGIKLLREQDSTLRPGDQRAAKPRRRIDFSARGRDGIAQQLTDNGPEAPGGFLITVHLNPLERDKDIDQLDPGNRLVGNPDQPGLLAERRLSQPFPPVLVEEHCCDIGEEVAELGLPFRFDLARMYHRADAVLQQRVRLSPALPCASEGRIRVFPKDRVFCLPPKL